MDIYDYTTASGKDLIKEYINKLPDSVKVKVLAARQLINDMGLEAFQILETRQLDKKLWEIKISNERIMYVITNNESVYFLNICKKQKAKADKTEIQKAIGRAKAAGLL